MALIETTDDFFTETTHLLNHGPLEEHCVLERLDGLYYSITGIKSHNQKSSLIIWDEFEQFIKETLVDEIQTMIGEYEEILPETIKQRYSTNSFYHQSTILFVYWMLKKKKRRLLADWPFRREVLEPLAIDLGISIFDD